MSKKRLKKRKLLLYIFILCILLVGGIFLYRSLEERERNSNKEVLHVKEAEVFTTGEVKNLYSLFDVLDERITLITQNHSLDTSTSGQKKAIVEYKNLNGKVEKIEIPYNVKKSTVPTPGDTKTTSKGFTIEEREGVTYIDGIVIANKTYSLSSTYGNGITEETQTAFAKMKAAATQDGIDLFIVSGFRSYARQLELYNNYAAKDGKDKADTYSARAGHSEHQTGLAYDLNSLSSSFGRTKEGIWIRENCYRFGFILRYLEGKSDETGYMYEPWHVRYVGEELAEKLYNRGSWISLENYFGITSKYQN